MPRTALSTKQKEMPARLRQYESYDHVRKQLQGFAKVNLLVQELKSEAVRERHWKQLTKRLGVNWLLPELTLGAVWDADLNRHETDVKDVLAIAQGACLQLASSRLSHMCSTLDLRVIYCMYSIL